MGKNVLVITGSPRARGNSDRLAEAFIRGAGAAGHTVSRFDAARKKLAGCTACDTCWSKGRACTIDDDFTQLSTLLEAADVLALAFPLYWSTMPSQLKAVVDRLYAYLSPNTQRKLKITQSVLLLCGECPGTGIFDAALAVHQGVCGFFGWQLAGTVLAPEVLHPGEVEKTDAPAQAEALGRGL